MTLQKKELNIQKFKEEIKEIIAYHDDVAVVDGEPTVCRETDCNKCLFNAGDNCTMALIDWLREEHEEPQILDEVEKKYLENIFKPFKDNIILVCKHYDKFNKCEEINFKTRFHNTESVDSLPYFDTGTMYKGMKQNKCYSLKELGLFLKK